MKTDRTYIAIDLKSFYASVECVERGYDPLTTNLLVADASRTEKTIVLAVSPSLKSYGLPGRPRLFEAVQRIETVNRLRESKAPGRKLTGESFNNIELTANPSLAVSYITAQPRMATYMAYSTNIYNIYLKYVSPQDMHVYSVDEVFIDATPYLKSYGMNSREFAMMMIRDVLDSTGITATVGIGTNLYLAKIAMDIVAKKMPADKDGVRIAELDEMSYRRQLWSHRPLRDFWRVGKGISDKLENAGIFTMGDIARVSLENEDILYKMFGINAELLIDHAWGWEPVGIPDIQAYRPENNSLSTGQVLKEPYNYDKALVVVKEMADGMAYSLLSKHLVTRQLELTIGYDVENLQNPERSKKYTGETVSDRYGRQIPKHAHGTYNLKRDTSSSELITEAAVSIFERTVNPELTIRRITIGANAVVPEAMAAKAEKPATEEQLSMFGDAAGEEKKTAEAEAKLEKERRRQEAILSMREKYGSDAILRGLNYREGATGRERLSEIGGHRK